MLESIGIKMTDFIYRSRWSWADRVAAFFVLAALFAFPYAGRIEGMILPVADDFEITRSEAIDDKNEVRIWGVLTLERPSCHFVATEWQWTGQTRTVGLPPPVYEEGPQLRPSGISEFGPWVLDIPERALGQVRGVAIHQCPWRPWRTVTPLYP